MRGLSALDGLAPGSEDVEGVPAALYDSTFSLQKDVLYYKIREYAAACRANKMEGTAMEASKVYYTDFRCPVGTSLLDKLRRVCIAAGIKLSLIHI